MTIFCIKYLYIKSTSLKKKKKKLEDTVYITLDYPIY